MSHSGDKRKPTSLRASHHAPKKTKAESGAAVKVRLHGGFPSRPSPNRHLEDVIRWSLALLSNSERRMRLAETIRNWADDTRDAHEAADFSAAGSPRPADPSREVAESWLSTMRAFQNRWNIAAAKWPSDALVLGRCFDKKTGCGDPRCRIGIAVRVTETTARMTQSDTKDSEEKARCIRLLKSISCDPTTSTDLTGDEDAAAVPPPPPTPPPSPVASAVAKAVDPDCATVVLEPIDE